jgi:hypothetical protein
VGAEEAEQAASGPQAEATFACRRQGPRFFARGLQGPSYAGVFAAHRNARAVHRKRLLAWLKLEVPDYTVHRKRLSVQLEVAL